MEQLDLSFGPVVMRPELPVPPNVIVDLEGLAKAVERILAVPGGLALDFETDGLDLFARENAAQIVGIAMGAYEDPSTDVYISIRHAEGPNCPPEAALAALNTLVKKKRKVYAHNIAFELRCLAAAGLSLPEELEDSMIAAHQVFEEERHFALKKLGVKYIGAAAADPEQELKKEIRLRVKHLKLKKNEEKRYLWLLPGVAVAPYALQDLTLMRQLLAFYYPMLEKWRLRNLYNERCKYRRVLTDMELRGLPLDVEELLRQQTYVRPRIEEIRKEINELAGTVLNPNSPVHMAKFVGSPNTKAELLKDLVEYDHNDRAILLLEYRSLSKADSSFFTPLLLRRSKTDRIHSNFNVARTKTQRLASSDPNAQQLSKPSSKRKHNVKSCFKAPEGYFLVEADLSAIEPRVSTHFSRDPGMIAAFKENLDIHLRAANQIYHEIVDKETKEGDEKRNSAKALSLGAQYSLGAFKAARKLRLRHDKDEQGNWEYHHEPVWRMREDKLEQVACSEVDKEYCSHSGKGYLTKFYESWPFLKPCQLAMQRQAELYGYIRSPLTGAVRRFPNKRFTYKAFNSMVQMTAGEILRLAIMKMAEEFTGPDDPQLVLCVHDSVVFLVKFSDKAYEQVKRVKHIMETTTTLLVPTPSDVKIGINYGNLGKVDFV